jgi:hypothetical protein
MSRNTAFLAIAAALAVLLGGVLASVNLGEQSAAAKEMLVLIEHVTNEQVVDLSDEGDTVGDTLVFSNELYDDQNANEVGRSHGSCMRTVVGESWDCTFTSTLENGSLVVTGPFYDDGAGTFAITGGTGDYAGASGQMTLQAAEGSTAENQQWEFTFEIA